MGDGREAADRLHPDGAIDELWQRLGPSPARTIAGFLLRSVVIYALLLAPWPGRVEAYGRLYRDAADLVYGSSDPEREVEILALGPDDTLTDAAWVADTGIVLSIERPGERPFRTQMLRSSHYTGWMPTALLIALILATPVTWSQRARALLLGIPAATAFALVMLGVPIHAWFYEARSLAAAGSEGALAATLGWISGALTEIGTWMGPYYLGAVLIWLLVTFGRRRPRAADDRATPGGS